MLVSQIVPGQEEGNYELIRRHDAGALAETPAEIVATLQRLFADDAAVWRRWRTNLKKIAHPAAARQIAATVLASAGQAAATTGDAAPVAGDPLLRQPAPVAI
jgi:processive 1,2-diacylglycerol beta-glucosyltransferase